jgi:amyloid beta precursor protein binding protein 1
MTADTTSYVELVNLYRARARADAALVHAHAQAVALSCGLGEDAVGIEQTRLFCKNAHSLQWLHFRALEEELAPQTARAAQLGALLDDGSEAPAAALYLLLRAADAFHAQYNRFPGTMDDDVESDVPLLKQCVTALLSELKTQAGSAPLSIRDDLIFEMCRYGASELHTVAAIVGGVGAQELIKLVTAQFVPMNNTYIYNGINGTGLVVEL